MGVNQSNLNTPWSEIQTRMEASEWEQIKSIVSTMDYNKMKVKLRQTFYLEKFFNTKEKNEYMKLLKEFLYMLRSIPSFKEFHQN